MTIDWNNLENNLDNILDDAANQTDEQLSTKIASLTTLSQSQIAAICPEKGDTQKLAELISVVKSAQGTNDKVNSIFSNAEKFGKIVVTLVSKFI